MKNNSSIFKTSMRFALLSIVFLLSFVSKVQSKVYKDSISTMTIDTITTDSTYIITETTMVETTSIDSAYSEIQSNTEASNPLDVNVIKNTQEEEAEMDSAMSELVKGLDVSAKMFEVFASTMDSSIFKSYLKNYLDSILTVSSGDLKTAIGKMNKYIRVNNSSSIINGLDVVAKLVHVQTNGKEVSGSELDSSFINSVSIDDLKRTTANFKAIKEQIERLKSEPSGKIVASELSIQFRSLFKDPLVIRVFKNAMSQAQKAANNTNIHTESRKFTTRVTYTAKRENELNQQP